MNIATAKRQIRLQISKLQEELATLERIEARLSGGASDLRDSSSGNGTHCDIFPNEVSKSREGANEVALVARALAAIGTYAIGKFFTKGDISKRIRELYPGTAVNEPSVSALLWNLERRGRLAIHEKGSGKKPSVYFRRDTTDRSGEIFSEPATQQNGTHEPDLDDF